ALPRSDGRPGPPHRRGGLLGHGGAQRLLYRPAAPARPCGGEFLSPPPPPPVPKHPPPPPPAPPRVGGAGPNITLPRARRSGPGSSRTPSSSSLPRRGTCCPTSSRRPSWTRCPPSSAEGSAHSTVRRRLTGTLRARLMRQLSAASRSAVSCVSSKAPSRTSSASMETIRP